MDLKTIKSLIQPFAIIFIIVFLAFNWSYISWMFNYRAISDVLLSFNKDTDNLTEIVENSIEINRLEVSAPLIMGKSQAADVLENDLKNGVAYYPGSALPGEAGQTVILGHSAPANWPKIRYDGVFSNISKLEAGDMVSVYYNGEKYDYIVKDQMILQKGEDLPNPLTNSYNMLLLVSCWPPGKDYQRIAVRAELTD
jgi:LPXTG-site transpeptidase (sortase) family protein